MQDHLSIHLSVYVCVCVCVYTHILGRLDTVK